MVAEIAPAPALETDELWRLTMEHSPVGMAIVSPTGGFMTANVALCEMLGHDADVLITKSFQDITHPDDLDADLRLFEQTLAGEISSYRITKRYLRADGSILVGDLSVALLRDPLGTPIHFISQIVDLSERQAFVDRLDAAEAAADAERRTAQAIFEGVAVGLLQIDAERPLPRHQRPAPGVPRARLPRRPPRPGRADRLRLRRRPAAARARRHAVGAGRVAARSSTTYDCGWGRTPTRAGRCRSPRAGSSTARVSWRAPSWPTTTSPTWCARWASRTSSSRRSPTSCVRRSRRRWPTSSCSTSRPTSAPEGHQQVTAARRNMLRLSHLVADLLFTTRVSAGSPLVDPYRVDLAVLLCEAVDAASLDADGRGRAASTSRVPDALPAVADGMRLRQVFDNLLDNAIAYSSPGGVVTVDLGERQEHVVLTVDRRGHRHRRRRRGPGVRPLLPRRERPPAPGARHRPGPHDRAQHRRGARRRGVAGEHARRGHQRLRAAAPLRVASRRAIRPAVARGPRRRGRLLADLAVVPRPS